MSKALVMGAACTAAAAGAYYVSPLHQQDLSTPPILVDGTPEEVLGKLRKITAQRYLEQMGAHSDELREVRFTVDGGTKSEALGTVYFASDRVLVLHAKARAVGGGKTELDIVPELPPSRFSTQPNLHPYDLKVVAAFADLAATDYAASVLKGDRPFSSPELGRAMEARIGFDQGQKRAFGDRMQEAVRAAYGRQLGMADYRDYDSDPDSYARDTERLPPENLNGSPGVDLSRYDHDSSAY